VIFSSDGSQLVEIEETSEHIKWRWGMDRHDHLEMCYQLREHDEQNGMSKERTMQHIASMDEITCMILLNTRPEVFRDAKEMHKWLATPEGKECRVSRDARPIKGNGLQLIIR
jgi:hypothetical protein